MKQMLAVDRRGVVRAMSAGMLVAVLTLLGGAPGARASASCSTVAGTTTCTYTQDDTFTVPPGVAQVTVQAISAPGGNGSGGSTGTVDIFNDTCTAVVAGGSGGSGGEGAEVNGTLTGLAVADVLDVTVASQSSFVGGAASPGAISWSVRMGAAVATAVVPRP